MTPAPSPRLAFRAWRPDDLALAETLFGDPANHGSRAVLARLGFRYAFDEFYPPTGLQHPGYLLRNPRRPAA